METKEELITNVKEWVKTDNDIIKLKKDIKELNQKKKVLTESLMQVMKKNEIDCFDLKDGAILYKKNTTKKPINGKTLMTALSAYYKNNAGIAEELTKHIMDSREEQVKETIKRKINPN
jgi:hypothetical protein